MYVKANRNCLVIAYIPLRGKFVTQPLHLSDSRPNRAEANKIKKELEHALHTGKLEAEMARRFPNSKRIRGLSIAIPREGQPTLGEYAQEWLAEKTQLTAATRYDYESLIKTHLLPHPIAALPLTRIDDGAITGFVNQIAAKTLPRNPEQIISHRRVNMVIARLRTIFATACRRGLIPADPMRHIKNLRLRRPDVDPFDLNETQRIIDAAQGWEKAFFATLLYTGMRPGEALALRWDAIARDLITIRYTFTRRHGFGLPKTPGSERDLEMVRPLFDIMRDHAIAQVAGRHPQSRPDLGLVFPNQAGQPIDINNIRIRTWPRILKAAEVRPRTLYQCRHTFARLAIEHGDTPQHVAAQLGHTSLQMLFRVYSRWLARPTGVLTGLERAISQNTQNSPKPA